jgi:hypothetical protein
MSTVLAFPSLPQRSSPAARASDGRLPASRVAPIAAALAALSTLAAAVVLAAQSLDLNALRALLASLTPTPGLATIGIAGFALTLFAAGECVFPASDTKAARTRAGSAVL